MEAKRETRYYTVIIREAIDDRSAANDDSDDMDSSTSVTSDSSGMLTLQQCAASPAKSVSKGDAGLPRLDEDEFCIPPAVLDFS